MHTDIFQASQWQQPFADNKALLTAVRNAHDLAIQRLYQAFEQGEKVEKLIQARSDFMDALLQRCWQHFFGHQNDGLSLIAVGGYGRRELLPHSDIDLLILGREEAFTASKAELEAFITFLWDTRLAIGHSVRNLDECIQKASEDITIVTNLMESRPLAGNSTLHARLMQQIGPEQIWPSREFFRAKWNEQIARHKKFNNTEYNLEPNMKSCPGGLRDIQMIGWVAKRHFGVNSIDDLVKIGFLTAEEYEIMVNGQSFLLKARFALHMITGREEDRLLFEHQTRIVKYFGYKDNTGNLAVEQMMKQYYRWALALSELNDLIMQLFDETILRACEPEEVMEINPRFRIRNNQIETANDKVFSQFPYALLEIFVLMAKHTHVTGVRASTIRQLRENRHLINQNFRNDPKNQQLFVELLRSPDYVTTQIKLMKRYGILGKYIPAFGKIIGQTQHDLFHIYTVDAHTILVLKNARRFTYEDMREQFPIASQVMKRMEKKDLLYIACLFHDIAKGRGGDHSTLGAEDAFEFCRKHGYNYRDSNLVAWLVKNHLLMSFTSQKKDISDPEIIHEFALKVGDILHLDYLFTLTVADINGTNPTLWNAWRASLLRQLYSDTKRAIRRGLGHVIDKHEWIEDTQHLALEKLKQAGIDEELVQLIWSNAGDDYFLRETANDVAWQTEAMVKQIDSNKPLVIVREAQDMIFNGATQIFVHTKNQIHTFAAVVAALEQQYLSIVDARIYSSNSGYTLDTFLVLDADGKPLELTDSRIESIQHTLEDILSSKKKIANITKRRTPRQLKFFSIPTHTNISHDKQKGYTILEVITADRPGLLATIGQIFVEFDIDLINAKISTLGERVEDIFFITDSNHKPLEDENLCTQIQAAICQRLDEQVAESN